MKKILPTLIAAAALAFAGSASAQAAAPKYTDVYFDAGSTMKIVDDETFSDTVQNFNLTGYVGRFDNAPAMNMKDQWLYVTRCAGGEVRVRIALLRRVYAGTPKISGRVDLYEGASCSTTDFGGYDYHEWQTLVPGWKYAHAFHVENEVDGDDYADATLKLSTVGVN